MEKPLISIIVPVYKVPEKYLKKCIDSLINQTSNNIEILLIDDGSPDNCGQICDEYSRETSKIKVIHKENGGLSSSRNTGVKKAKGKYVMFVDGDDWLDLTTCEVLETYIVKTEVDLLMFCMSKEYGGKTVPYVYNLEENHLYKGKEIEWLQAEVLNYNSNIATATTKLIKKSVLIDNQIFHNEQLRQGAEGILFNVELFGKISNAQFINEHFYHYTYNPDSISASYDETNIYLVLGCFEEIKKKIDALPHNQNLVNSYRNRVVYAITAAVISGFFNPSNPDKYQEKRNKCKKYLNNPTVKDCLYDAKLDEISKSRRVIVFMLKKKMFRIIQLMGKIRKWQKTHS